MWELDYKESWVLKNWCFWTVLLEKTLESLLGCKEIQPVHPKGDQSWIVEGLMLKLKLQYFGHLVPKTDSFEKTLMLGKTEGGRSMGNFFQYLIRKTYNGKKSEKEGKEICLQCRRPGFDSWVGKISWRRKWQPTPVFFPGKSHGQRRLVGYSPQV